MDVYTRLPEPPSLDEMSLHFEIVRRMAGETEYLASRMRIIGRA